MNDPFLRGYGLKYPRSMAVTILNHLYSYPNMTSKNIKLFDKYREAHPDCKQYHSKYSDQYHKIIYESMGGKGDNDFEKHEKIIKNVLKEVTIDKNL